MSWAVVRVVFSDIYINYMIISSKRGEAMFGDTQKFWEASGSLEAQRCEGSIQ